MSAHMKRETIMMIHRFFEDLASGKKISVILAPAFLANYPKEYQRVLGYLKSKGVSHICSVSFGADITTLWISQIHYGTQIFRGISQPCPAVVTYVEKYIPELIPRLMPVHSPMMCTAIYMKNTCRSQMKSLLSVRVLPKIRDYRSKLRRICFL